MTCSRSHSKLKGRLGLRTPHAIPTTLEEALGTCREPLKNNLDSTPKSPGPLIENADSWGPLLDSESRSLE